MKKALQKMTDPSSLLLSGLEHHQPAAVTAKSCSGCESCDSNPRLLQSCPAQYQQNQLVVEYSHSLEGTVQPSITSFLGPNVIEVNHEMYCRTKGKKLHI